MNPHLLWVPILHLLVLAWLGYRIRTEPPAVGRLRLEPVLGPLADRREVRWLLAKLAGWDEVTLLAGLAVVACCLWFGAELFENIAEDEWIVQADDTVSVWIDRSRWPLVTRAAEALSSATGPSEWIPFCVGLAAVLTLLGHRWIALCLALGGCGTGLSTAVVKSLLARQRPPGVDIYHPHGDAFPSGHTSGTAFVTYFVAWLATRRRSPSQRALAFGAAACLTFLVGASRMYLAVHWMSDILGGLAFGLCWAVGTVLLARGREVPSTRVVSAPVDNR